MLRASSWMGKPGIAVPKRPPSGVSYTGVYWPLREGERSNSVPKDGGSDTTGVKDTRGGAVLDGTTVNDDGRSGAEDREEKADAFTEATDGRFCSPVRAPRVPLGGGKRVEDVKGAAKLFFIRENKEVTRA